MHIVIVKHPKCCGKTTLWLRGDEVFRVTARKDEWGEVQSYDGKPDGSVIPAVLIKRKPVIG